MLSLLKNNAIFSAFLIPILAIVMWWPSFISPPVIPIKHSMPLFEMFVQLLGNDLLFKSIIAFILVVIEGFYLNYLIDKNNLLSRKSFLPAFAFVMMMSGFKSVQQLHPIVCALLFVMLSLSKIAKTYRQDSALSNVFDASFLLSVASLFYFPITLLYPIVWVSLIVIRPFVWREWIVSLIGFVMPYVFTLTFYYWFNRVNFFVFDKIIFPASFNIYDVKEDSIWYLLACLFILVIGIWGMFHTIFKSVFNTTFARNMSVIMVWFLLLSAGIFFISPQANIIYTICTFIPFTYYLSATFIDLKKKWIAESLLFLFITLAFCNLYIH